MRWPGTTTCGLGMRCCTGQILQISQNQALFSVLGNRFGGDGTKTFALPDLQGRCAVGVSSSMALASTAGLETVALSNAQVPAHTHVLNVNSASGPLVTAVAGNSVGVQGNSVYNASADTLMDPGALGMAGTSQPHENRTPFVVLTWVIALQGTYPSQS